MPRVSSNQATSLWCLRDLFRSLLCLPTSRDYSCSVPSSFALVTSQDGPSFVAFAFQFRWLVCAQPPLSASSMCLLWTSNHGFSEELCQYLRGYAWSPVQSTTTCNPHHKSRVSWKGKLWAFCKVWQTTRIRCREVSRWDVSYSRPIFW